MTHVDLRSHQLRNIVAPTYSRSGRILRLRYATDADAPQIADLLLRLSPDSLLLRYLTPRRLTRNGAQMEASRMLAQAKLAGAVLIVTTPHESGETPIAVGELAIDPAAATRAEFALVVRDDYQADGVGSLLIRALVAEASRTGVATLCADFLPINTPMRRLAGRLGLPFSLILSPTEWQLALHLAG
jgi:GNAT superfamily N-acetyltransferase